MSNGLNLKFKVLCDNFLEFERFFEITLGSLNLKRSDFETKKTCPLAITHKNLPVSFEVMVGFGRWGDNYWESDANKSNYIKENPDVLVSLETNNSKKLFAIEFCSALPAGNQAWQRFARGKEFSRNGVDYFFISHIGGVELGANRKELSIRYPNPIVNFASNKHNFESEFGFYINLIEETPGCPDQIVSNFKDCIGVEPLIEYIHSATLNQTITDEMLVYQKNLINCYIKTKKNLSDFETDALKGFLIRNTVKMLLIGKRNIQLRLPKKQKKFYMLLLLLLIVTSVKTYHLHLLGLIKKFLFLKNLTISFAKICKYYLMKKMRCFSVRLQVLNQEVMMQDQTEVLSQWLILLLARILKLSL